MMTFTRVLLALEFTAALVTWALGVCAWPIAGAVATGALTMLMLTWDLEPAPASRPPFACRLLGHAWAKGAPELGGPAMYCRRLCGARRYWPRPPRRDGHIVHEGARGYWCGGVDSAYPCPDCAPPTERSA